MKIVFGADHAGFRLKDQLRAAAASWGYEVVDVGTNSAESVDYPSYAQSVGDVVLNSPVPTLGVLVCGTGLGISMAANKLPGIRAARCDEPYSASMARAHNDANVLCLGERVVGAGVAELTMRAFLETPFEGGRHQRRVDQLNALDRGR